MIVLPPVGELTTPCKALDFVTNANMLVYLWESAICPVLLYGSSSVHINKESMLKMEKLQAKLLKTSIGVHKFCKSSSIYKLSTFVK